MGHIMKAPKVQLNVQPAIIDDTKTRLNIDIHAATAHSARQSASRSYNNLEIKSLYGIYYRITDEKIIHILHSSVVSLLLQ
jgi:hypothetical protein